MLTNDQNRINLSFHNFWVRLIIWRIQFSNQWVMRILKIQEPKKHVDVVFFSWGVDKTCPDLEYFLWFILKSTLISWGFIIPVINLISDRLEKRTISNNVSSAYKDSSYLNTELLVQDSLSNISNLPGKSTLQVENMLLFAILHCCKAISKNNDPYDIHLA